jgi:dTDP-4-amino-4,6-dideoxygalactose transaminase
VGGRVRWTRWRRWGIAVIEDAAHALGAEWRDRKIGDGTADFTCFSLQAIKHITSVDGGILACRTEGDYRRGRLLRWYGIDRDTGGDFRCAADIAEPGLKWHMNDVTAVIGLAQLPYLDLILAGHRANAAYYAGRVPLPFAGQAPGARGAWWLYTVLLGDGAARDLFAKHMGTAGVQVSRVHARNDTLSCFAPYAAGPLPGTDEFAARMCCVPVHAGLTGEQRRKTADEMIAFHDHM